MRLYRELLPNFVRTTLIALLFIVSEIFREAYSVECRQCEKQFGSCDDGVCTGKTCVLIEAVNSQFRKVVKTCSPKEQHKSECFVAYPDGIESVHCFCIYDWCNSEEEIKKSGLIKIRHDAGTQPASDNTDRNKRTNSDNSRTLAISTNSIVLLIFLCLFVCAAFSLLIIHTMC